MSSEEIFVSGWPQPKGYANGRTGAGTPIHVGGQIGWDERGQFATRELAGQFAKALDNVLAVVRAAGGAPSDIAEMTVFVTDVDAYRQGRTQLGPIWRERMGQHYPAMALVAVAALVEPEAVVEIQAVAYVGGAP
jgi:enamine deaminase RidA (YjgF/YER057c/UK114 family)